MSRASSPPSPSTATLAEREDLIASPQDLKPVDDVTVDIPEHERVEDHFFKEMSFKELLAVYAGLTFIQMTVSLDRNTFRPLVPNLATEYHSLREQYLFATTASLVWMATFPVFGKLAQIFGRKLPMLISIGLFVVGALLNTVSAPVNERWPSFGGEDNSITPAFVCLLLARAIQSIGSGGIGNSVAIIISDIVSLRDRSKYQSYMEIILILPHFVGPFGTYLYTSGHWQGIFYISASLGALCFVYLLYVLQLPAFSGPVAARLKRVDWLGTLLAVSTTSCLCLGLSLGSKFAFNSAAIITLLCFGFVLMGVFIAYEIKFASEPLLPMRLFKNRNVALLFVIAILMVIANSGHAYQSTMFQVIRGLGPRDSGLIDISEWCGDAVTRVVVSFLIAKYFRYRYLLFVAPLIMALGSALLAYLHSDTSIAELVVQQWLIGMGTGMDSLVVLLAVQASVDHRDMAIVTSMFFFCRSFGGAIGSASFGAIYKATVRSSLFSRFPAGTPEAVVDAAMNGIRGVKDRTLVPLVKQAYMDTNNLIMWIVICILGLAALLPVFVKHYKLHAKLGAKASRV